MAKTTPSNGAAVPECLHEAQEITNELKQSILTLPNKIESLESKQRESWAIILKLDTGLRESREDLQCQRDLISDLSTSFIQYSLENKALKEAMGQMLNQLK